MGTVGHKEIRVWQRLGEVLHPFHPDEDNRAAFAHALKIAWVTGARLSLMSLQPSSELLATDGDEPWQTLTRWRDGQPSESTAETDLRVQHLRVAGEDPVRACLTYLRRSPTDLVVLATRLQQGRMGWLGRSTAGALASKAGEMTLLVPQGVKGFVSSDDGAINLDSILVAVAQEPRPEPAVEAARRILLSASGTAGTVTIIHVGDAEDMPELRLPDTPGWSWDVTCKSGDVVDRLLTTAAETHAGLIVMTTKGYHGFLDMLRGTVTEHILREANCPLLAMPAGSFLG